MTRNNNIFFNIIVPTKNRRETLEHTLKCIESQNYQNYQLIILDNNSTDGTENFIQNLSNKNIVYENSNKKFIKHSSHETLKKILEMNILYLEAPMIYNSDVDINLINRIKFKKKYSFYKRILIFCNLFMITFYPITNRIVIKLDKNTKNIYDASLEAQSKYEFFNKNKIAKLKMIDKKLLISNCFRKLGIYNIGLTAFRGLKIFT